MHLLTDYLRQLDKDEVVCVIDAYDVLMLRPLEELEQAFRQFHARTKYEIVAGCETASSKNHELLMKWLFGTCRNKFLNAGTYVGFAGALRDLVAGVKRLSNNDLTADDQQLMTIYCSESCGGGKMYMDCPGEFFLTLSGDGDGTIRSNLRVTDRQLVYKNQRPYFIHANAQANINSIVCQLGYAMPQREHDRLVKYIEDTNHKKFYDYLPRFSVSILALVCCCIVLALKVKARFGFNARGS